MYLAVRAPGDIGDVTFCGKVVYLQINGFPAGKIVHANGYLFRVHAVHGVFDLLELSGAGVDVQKGKPGNLVLVFAVKGHFAAVRRHVPAGVNPELVAAYRFSVYQVGAVGGGNHKALLPLVVPGEEAAAVCEEGVALFGGFLGFVGKGAVGLQEHAGNAGIAHALVDGLFHGEVFTVVGGLYVHNGVLGPSKVQARRAPAR